MTTMVVMIMEWMTKEIALTKHDIDYDAVTSPNGRLTRYLRTMVMLMMDDKIY